jgi:membrane protein DedA with SNARE-associated domain
MFVGDWLWWKIGFSYGYSFVEKYGRYFFLRKEKLTRLTVYVKNNNNGVLFRSKFVYGTGHIMLLLWGIAKQSFKDFWQLNLLGNILSYIIFTTLGYYFGKSLQAWNWYFKIAAMVVFILILWSTHWLKRFSFSKAKSN